MSRVKWGVVFAALLAGTVARATEISGRVVCTGTETGVDKVQVTVSQYPYSYSAVSDASGNFTFHISYGSVGMWNLALDLSAAGGASSVVLDPVYLSYGSFVGPIQVNVPVCAPPPPACPALEDITDGENVCANLGNPNKECGAFLLAPSAINPKDDNLNAMSYAATTEADLALVKAGACYKLILDVDVGDILTPPGTQAISHVTYCSCR